MAEIGRREAKFGGFPYHFAGRTDAVLSGAKMQDGRSRSLIMPNASILSKTHRSGIPTSLDPMTEIDPVYPSINSRFNKRKLS